MRENADHPDNEQELVSLAIEEMDAKVYVDAWSVIVITVMKVGYGMHQVTFLEEAFLFLLMFVSAFVFALAAQYTAPLQLRSPLKQFLVASQQDLQNFIQVLRSPNGIKKPLNPRILDIISRCVNLQICYSTKVAFRTPLYKKMPPHLKKKLVDLVLEK